MEARRIPNGILAARLEDPNTTIIDVRRDRDQSDEKIFNAVEEDPDKVESWADKYSGQQSIVLYCS